MVASAENTTHSCTKTRLGQNYSAWPCNASQKEHLLLDATAAHSLDIAGYDSSFGQKDLWGV